MTVAREPDSPLAIVCGSETLVGSAMVARLRAAGWDVFTIDPGLATSHPDATASIHGEIRGKDVWGSLRRRIRAMNRQPEIFVHALSGAVAGSPGSAELGCQVVLPLMPEHGAVVLVASVLAGWDTRADAAEFSASQAGLLALMRAQALLGAPAGIRVNAVCTGLVADASESISVDVLGRIPLGKAASPDEVADAALFLLSPDARHITGSTLVVDGGQSLQSWSNAPRTGHYPLTRRTLTPQPPPRGYPAPVEPRERGTQAARRFEGQTVLITGAAGGLGSAAARRFAAEGANLALLDRDGDAAERLAVELVSAGRGALAVAVDVTDERAFAAAIARAEEHFGQIDVVFNNAGIGSRSFSVAEMPVDDWDEVIAVNLRGIFLGCKYGVPALMRAGGGAIVNMGSSTGRHDTITGGAAYMASKAAVEALTKSLALQVAPFGIRANTICPGIIQTQLSFRQQERGDEERFFGEFAARTPLGRVGQPEDVAAAVAFLASDQARHITGASLLIDGGQTLRKWINAPDLDEMPGKETFR